MTKTLTPAGVDGALEYLRAKFDWVELHDTPTGSIVFDVCEGRDRWRVTFSEEFLAGRDPEEVRTRLEDWNLAGEMRRAEGMGLSVSTAGVRLDSSN